MSKNFRRPNCNDGNTQISNSNYASFYAVNAQKQNGDCVVCKRNAVCVCQRCGDFYCSPDCQRRDWPAHRYICFPMPNLVSPCAYGAISQNHSVLDISSESRGFENNRTGNGEKKQEPPRNTVNASYQHQAGRNNVNRPVQYNKAATIQRNPQTGGHPPTSPIPKHNSRVLLAGFRSPNRCYIRSLAPSEMDGFMSVAKEIDAYGKNAPELTKFPQQNSYAIAKLDGSGVMYRVQVLSVSGNSIRVLFIDNGTTAIRKLSELREISDHILSLHQYTVQVHLRNVENYEMNPELVRFLSQFEDQEFKLEMSKNDDARSSAVVLRHWQSNESLNEQIIKFASKMDVFTERKSEASLRGKENVGTGSESKGVKSDMAPIPERNQDKIVEELQKQTNDNVESGEVVAKRTVEDTSLSATKPVMIAPFERQTLTAGAENIDVIVVDNSCLNFGFFACITRTNIDNFSAIQEYLANMPDTKEAYKPCLNEYCIAKYEGDWYRAKVTTIPSPNEYTVVYIDYTNESTVGCADIRPYPADLRYNCTTSTCMVYGIPSDVGPKLHQRLKELVPLNRLIKVDKVRKVDDQFVYVNLEWLIKKLQEENFM